MGGYDDSGTRKTWFFLTYVLARMFQAGFVLHIFQIPALLYYHYSDYYDHFAIRYILT